MLNKRQIISQTEEYVKNLLVKENSGHDWYHIALVRRNALNIAEKEKNVDLFVVELVALLHDIADHKNHGGDYEIGPKLAKEWLESLKVKKDIINHVVDIVGTISFSKNTGSIKTKEGEIVQDADRLEALGAVGIARCFATGAKMGRPIYDPNDEEGNYSIQHFYDKLLKLKKLMNTKTGKKMAEKRHAFMEKFLKQFYKEWAE